MKHAINWFEIPVVNYDRASKFYSTILNAQVHRLESNPTPYGLLPSDGETAVGGALAQGDDYVPATNGTVVYLNAGTPANIDTMLGRVEAAGGKVVAPKMSIGENGWIAFVLDTEGNKVGLHAPN
ncbi:MAG: VOC family protein [Anaerolineae bacterium]